MKSLRAIPIPGLLTAAIFLLAPAGAIAAEGIQIGPALLFPALGVTATHDDNVHLASENPESGWVTSIAPALRLELPVRRFTLSAEGGLDFLSYHGVEERNGADWFVGAAVGADFPGGLSFKLADRHAKRYLPGTQEFGDGEDFTLNTLSASVAYAIRDALRLEISGNRTQPTFELSVQRDRVETTVQADLHWRFRPALSALIEASQVTYAYDSLSAQDNSAIQAAAGLTWDVTSRSAGLVKAGFQWKRYEAQDPSLGTEDGSYYTLLAGVRHSFTRRTLLGIDLSRASRESDYPQNPYYLRTAAAASLSQRFTPKIHARVGVQYGSDDYPNAVVSGFEAGERTDTTLGGSAALGFDATRWLTLELAAGVESRNSTIDSFDYDVARVSLSAKAAF